MLRFVPGASRVVLDSPHSGVDYPADFRYCCPLPELRRAEDTHVEKLFDFAPRLGASWIEALFPRSYLDVNRNVTELDVGLLTERWPGPVETDPAALAKIRLGKGLVWRWTDDGVAIYDRHLTVAEVEARIEKCWVPYHAAVAQAIDTARDLHAASIHVNCHSMPSVAASHATEFPGLAHADFVIGDRDGSTADPRLTRSVCALLRGMGYTVDYNHPYKGVELVRRHGDPRRGRHSFQLEINRRLYMDENSLELTGGVHKLRADLMTLVEFLLAIEVDCAGE